MRPITRFAGCLIVLAAIASSVRAAVLTYAYDLYATNPDSLPNFNSVPPYQTNNDADVPVESDSATIANNVLTLSTADGSGFNWVNAQSIVGYSAADEVNINARVKVNSVARTSGRVQDLSVFGANVILGTKRLGFGVSLDGTAHTFFLSDSNYQRYSTRVIKQTANADDGFFDVRIHKDADTDNNVNNDALHFFIDGVDVTLITGNNNVGGVTLGDNHQAFNVTTFGDLENGSGFQIKFGQSMSSFLGGSGESAMTGVSFGFGGPAPALIPEPTTLSLLTLAAPLMLRRKKCLIVAARN
jgi:hypothetical protein